jgi:hypothetical protein
VSETQPLRNFFQQLVHNTYAGRLGLNDPEVTGYVAELLTDFSKADRLYRLRDADGRPLRDLGRMLEAADPVHGSAASFDAERAVRKYIGDYVLFLSGMYPREAWRGDADRMLETGKQSYFIVSQFDLFEYAAEAPLFIRLHDWYERCIEGLRLVREEMGRRTPAQLPPPAPM